MRWTPNGNGGAAITGWDYRQKAENETGFGDWTDIPNSGAGTTSYTVTGLTNGTSYQFKVRATNSVGDGAASPASVAVAALADAPGTPEKPTATAANESVSLSWKTVDDGGAAISRWDWQKKAQDESDFGTWWTVPNSGPGTTSHTVTGLTNGTAYRFRVRAVNSTGASDASPATDSVTPATPATAPSAPGTPTATPGNAKVALTWTAQDDDGGSAVTSWRYQQKAATDSDFGAWKTIQNSGASTTSHTVTGLTNGTAYRFKVRAVNGVGAGTASEASAAATPFATPGKPATPTLSDARDGKVTVSWTAPADNGMDIAGYDLEYRSYANGAWSDWTSAGRKAATPTSAVIGSLKNGTRYQFRIRAVNLLKNGPWSDAAEATPVGAPDTPAAPTVAAGSEHGVLNVTWTLPSDGGSPLVRQRLEWKPCEGNGCYSYGHELDGSVTSQTLSGLKYGTTYHVKLYVENQLGKGKWSPTATGKTTGAPADTPPDGDDDDGNGNGDGGGGAPPPGGDGQGGDDGGDGGGGDNGGGGDDGDDGVVPEPPLEPPLIWVGDLALQAAGEGVFVLNWKGEWKAAGGTLAIESRAQEHGWREILTGLPAAPGEVRIEGLDPEAAYTFRLRRTTPDGRVLRSDEISGVPDDWRGRCRGGLRYLCLRDRRFEVRTHWSNPDVAGELGNGGAVEVGISDESGLFWFFDPANVELVVKVLDGREINGAHWVFFGALSDVEYWLTVRDTATGAARTYHNAPKEMCGQSDLTAFEGAPPEASGSPSTAGGWPELGGTELPGLESASLLPLEAAPPGVAGPAQPGLDPESAAYALPSPAPPGVEAVALETAPFAAAAPQASAGACVPGARTLCLLDGRFALEVEFIDPNVTDPEATAEKPGYVLPSLTTEQTGFFWFFNAENIELAAKVLDGRGLNGRHWLLYGGLSDVEYTLTATDTVTGLSKTYRNEPGSVCGKIDTDAF